MENSTQHMHSNYVRPCPIAPFCLLNNVLDGPESTTDSEPTATPASTPSSSSSHTSSIVPVVAGVVGGVLALALLSVAVILFLRRRRRRRDTSVKLVPTTLDPVDLLLEDKGAKIYPLYPVSSQGTLLYVSHVPVVRQCLADVASQRTLRIQGHSLPLLLPCGRGPMLPVAKIYQ